MIKGFNMSASVQKLPYKSFAAALIFGVLLGPIGLLYGTYWGGFLMISIALYVVYFKLYLPTVLCWLLCCIWNVGAVESYNKKILKLSSEH